MALSITFSPTGSRKKDVAGQTRNLVCEVNFTRSSLSWRAAKDAGHERHKIKFTTKIGVIPALFGAEAAQRVNRKHPNAAKVNSLIESFTEQCRIAHETALTMPAWPSNFKEMLDGIHAEVPKERDVLADYAAYIFSIKQRGVSAKFAQNQMLALETLRRYAKARKATLIYETFDITWQADFFDWLRRSRQKGTGLLHPNTVGERLRLIKTFLGHAEKAKWTKADAWHHIQPVVKRLEEKVCVSVEEIERMMAVERDALKKNSRGQKAIDSIFETLDWFLFACFVGARHGDCRPEKMRFFQRNKKWFVGYTQSKKKKYVEVPLNRRVIEMLERRGWQLPKFVTVDNANIRLNIVCEAVGISKNVTWHVARRAFATMMEAKGAPRNWIMAVGGWSTESSYLLYNNLKQSDSAARLSEFMDLV